MDIEYVNILTGENLSSIKVASMVPIYWQFVYPVEEEGIGFKRWMGEGIVSLASCECHFINVHENLAQHPSNNISIPTVDKCSMKMFGAYKLISMYSALSNSLVTIQG